MDHDQRFKAMIREFFGDFMELFFPEWAACFDLTNPEWLEQEVLPNPPDGERHVLDLVAKLRTTKPLTDGLGETPDTWLALIHVEIEAPDRTTRLKPRLPRYYIHLRERQGLPVLPIVLYLQVGLEGIGLDVVEERIGDLTVMTFRYLYVGLPSLDAVQYVRGTNWLGVALSALMDAPKEARPHLGFEALQRLLDAPINDHQRFLLSDCLQAYLPLDEEGQKLYEEMNMAESFSRLFARNKTAYDQAREEAREQGLEQGRVQTLREIVIALLESRFQSVGSDTLTKIQQLTPAQLRAVVTQIPNAKSLSELFGQ